MTIEEMIASGINIEGSIEIKQWIDYDNDKYTILFQDDAWELDANAWYANVDVAYMYAYDNYDGIVLCFELEK